MGGWERANGSSLWAMVQRDEMVQFDEQLPGQQLKISRV